MNRALSLSLVNFNQGKPINHSITFFTERSRPTASVSSFKSTVRKEGNITPSPRDVTSHAKLVGLDVGKGLYLQGSWSIRGSCLML